MENYFKELDFSRYSSIKIGPKAEVLVINEIGEYKDYQIMGRCNNTLVGPDHPKFAILGEEFDYIKQVGDLLYVGCATTSGKLLTYTRNNDIADLEFLAKLPGNMGGLVKMNAGLKSWEVFNYVHSIKTKDGYIKKEDVEYSYRHTKLEEIVYEVVFNISYGFSKDKLKEFNKMRDNQPHVPSAGSCFINPKDDYAGRLIEAIGLKGFEKGNMSFSKQHANFLVNNGDGTYEDAVYLINLAKSKIKEQFNIDIKEEVIIY
ncbi:UDP-N-acetylmuramate dehydrogenase [Poseidonibacter ostreae]|jgi:UDP-N-acetylmuramate dehydrogenase|uniref:UDP-N-acetylenolpyruvoylglucosamine reductase n=1 Tax=Poseidonibacter ostreae TaxID=2654171 RepID=A0A6L4WS46_9BACT|nr:UDP-N-acetylmuramate dehydrogenase [Poseidonibacter ostreae]KAB7886703.1 UDP-N-acetylmuramate dehydrogenase [Poseidonibacter ostreae]KAB7888173.1 UDP-N-acetylmuramate dehydrogenase [Poseidonibacter ostreae]KAB7892051.1 UDP-N-acetylmuramate dehydrogenase [Poseidonibacter ostreae]MAC84052.1 UDP-N-acetylenolpyruvoylglucosamine reductase [Arcobacter sp.]|tara:strand:- start:29 stop:808 length:780 start_codon:yes stop_codon:yes gene_type:complete